MNFAPIGTSAGTIVHTRGTIDGQLLNEMGYVAGRLKQVSDQIKELRKDE